MPRIHCSKKCGSFYTCSLPVYDWATEEEIINGLKKKYDVKVVKVGPKNKRKISEYEDDEMQE